MDKEKLNWRSFADAKDTYAKWNAGTPAYYVIDHKGVIRYKWVGVPGEKAIDAAIEKLIHEAEEKGKNTPNAQDNTRRRDEGNQAEFREEKLARQRCLGYHSEEITGGRT